ncbi:hypothetical protein PIB30_039029 [Stylosanthes scabra]|uniref:Uncharacterized protein n=1 Tax=Stylosanthes scabra TaxID=79078 RepID=A0ABU6REA7_9FABA|nr:hypothetical protein [Stylosanthes scabra]
MCKGFSQEERPESYSVFLVAPCDTSFKTSRHRLQGIRCFQTTTTKASPPKRACHGLCDNSGNSSNLGSLSDETLYRVNDTFVDGSRRADCGIVKAIEQGSGGDSIEDDNSAEFCATKEVRCRGGLFFDSSELEEVRSKLNRQKRLEGKKRTDLKPKDQCQGKKPPCIQGRTLATRKLMSSTKFNLK